MKPAQSPVPKQGAHAADSKQEDAFLHPPGASAPKGLAGGRDPLAPPVRIDVRRMARMVFYSLLLPVGAAIGLDFLTGFFPYLTIAAVVLVFPIAGFLVMRTALREMNSVIDQVAPEEVEEEAPAAAGLETGAVGTDPSAGFAPDAGTDNQMENVPGFDPTATKSVNKSLSVASEPRRN